MAAGMGSRYGGLKQLDGLGPNGETIMDYSIYDAMRAGFGKVVFIIRHSFEEEFRKKVISKYENKIDVEIVFQELDKLPEGFTPKPDREKPWGTGHAVLMAAEVVKEPFLTINADDFYGADSYKVAARYLSSLVGKEKEYCMVGYVLGNTLSDGGTVARGVCERDSENYLAKIVERTQIERRDGVPSYNDGSDVWQPLSDDTLVSMNMFGFTPDFFDYCRSEFASFLKAQQDVPKSEFLIPTIVNDMVNGGEAKVKVLSTSSEWFGVTYATDRPGVVEKIANLVKSGEYPSKLF